MRRCEKDAFHITSRPRMPIRGLLCTHFNIRQSIFRSFHLITFLPGFCCFAAFLAEHNLIRRAAASAALEHTTVAFDAVQWIRDTRITADPLLVNQIHQLLHSFFRF
jgi:hypothetical protein